MYCGVAQSSFLDFLSFTPISTLGSPRPSVLPAPKETVSIYSFIEEALLGFRHHLFGTVLGVLCVSSRTLQAKHAALIVQMGKERLREAKTCAPRSPLNIRSVWLAQALCPHMGGVCVPPSLPGEPSLRCLSSPTLSRNNKVGGFGGHLPAF